MQVKISSMTISDGTVLKPKPLGVTVFVGPNNAGKSQALRDIFSQLDVHPPPRTSVVSTLQLNKEGDSKAFMEWITENCYRSFNHQGIEVFARNGSMPAAMDHLAMWWTGLPTFPNFAALFTFFAHGATRLEAANAVETINFVNQAPSHPLHVLYRDPELEQKVSAIARKTFGTNLILDRYSGATIPLRVGDNPPGGEHRVDGPPPLDYLEALQALPTLDEQGDGMRSFVGIVLNLEIGETFISLIDEPEAFLHPPQARLMGQRLMSSRSQTIVATHSIDILDGMLDVEGDLEIVRMTRDGTVNQVSVLPAEDVRQLKNDPLLRHSRLLDGLFHEGIILCEGDTDCQFYEAVLRDIWESESGDAAQPQLLFTHCGGKSRMPTVVKTMRSLGVPIAVVADFDVLDDESLLKRLVGVLGGEWSHLRADWQVVDQSLRSDSRPIRTAFIRQEFPGWLDELDAPIPSDDQLARLRGNLRAESGWSKAKRSGIGGVAQGPAFSACRHLIDQLQLIGLFVVEVGELERYVPDIPGHGPQWVIEVFESGRHQDKTLKARSMLRQLSEGLL